MRRYFDNCTKRPPAHELTSLDSAQGVGLPRTLYAEFAWTLNMGDTVEAHFFFGDTITTTFCHNRSPLFLWSAFVPRRSRRSSHVVCLRRTTERSIANSKVASPPRRVFCTKARSSPRASRTTATPRRSRVAHNRSPRRLFCTTARSSPRASRTIARSSRHASRTTRRLRVGVRRVQHRVASAHRALNNKIASRVARAARRVASRTTARSRRASRTRPHDHMAVPRVKGYSSQSKSWC